MQGANTLVFTGSQANAFSVNGNTLLVDTANDRLGAGTITPNSKLTVSIPYNSYGLSYRNATQREDFYWRRIRLYRDYHS